MSKLRRGRKLFVFSTRWKVKKNLFKNVSTNKSKVVDFLILFFFRGGGKKKMFFLLWLWKLVDFFGGGILILKKHLKPTNQYFMAHGIGVVYFFRLLVVRMWFSDLTSSDFIIYFLHFVNSHHPLKNAAWEAGRRLPHAFWVECLLRGAEHVSFREGWYVAPNHRTQGESMFGSPIWLYNLGPQFGIPYIISYLFYTIIKHLKHWES